MTTRTTTNTVTFRNPFILDSHNETQPAGDYVVESDEELIDGLSFPAFRRTLTLLHLHRKGGIMRTWTIDPKDLETALARDQIAAESPISENFIESPIV